jgi:hypothetical protein
LRDVFVGTTVERVVRRSGRPLLVAVDSPKAQYRRTLLALDFDEVSKFAARQALAMGLFDQTSVTVMRAFDKPAAHMMKRAFEPGTEVQRYVKSEERTAIAELASLRDHLELPPTSQLVAAMLGSPAPNHPRGRAWGRQRPDRAWHQSAQRLRTRSHRQRYR